jgi:hypothetical protein
MGLLGPYRGFQYFFGLASISRAGIDLARGNTDDIDGVQARAIVDVNRHVQGSTRQLLARKNVDI